MLAMELIFIQNQMAYDFYLNTLIKIIAQIVKLCVEIMIVKHRNASTLANFKGGIKNFCSIDDILHRYSNNFN